MKKTYSGSWRPKHPEKYNGNVDMIHYRSLWERNALLNPLIIIPRKS